MSSSLSSNGPGPVIEDDSTTSAISDTSSEGHVKAQSSSSDVHPSEIELQLASSTETASIKQDDDGDDDDDDDDTYMPRGPKNSGIYGQKKVKK